LGAVADYLSPEDVFVDLVAPDKQRLLQVLAYRAANRLGLDENLIAADVLAREALGSTGVGKGVAIPHARLQGLQRPFAMAARLKRPIEFDAIDGEPVDVVFLLLMPHDQTSGQMNIMAAVARKLRAGDTLTSIRKATDATALFAILAAG
jgi:nitrogen PTS system EIIA component